MQPFIPQGGTRTNDLVCKSQNVGHSICSLIISFITIILDITRDNR